MFARINIILGMPNGNLTSQKQSPNRDIQTPERDDHVRVKRADTGYCRSHIGPPRINSNYYTVELKRKPSTSHETKYMYNYDYTTIIVIVENFNCIFVST